MYFVNKMNYIWSKIGLDLRHGLDSRKSIVSKIEAIEVQYFKKIFIIGKKWDIFRWFLTLTNCCPLYVFTRYNDFLWVCQSLAKKIADYDPLKVSRSRNKMSSCNFSQKNEWMIFFSILTTRKYLKLEFRSTDL